MRRRKWKIIKGVIFTLFLGFLMIISTNPVIVYAAESKDTGNGNFVFYFVFAIIGSMLLATVVSLLENLINKIKSKSKASDLAIKSKE